MRKYLNHFNLNGHAMYRTQILPLLLLFFTSHSVWATEWFKNSAQQAQEAFAQKAYEKSADLFTDPYQRGVALYRNGQYAEAAEAFASVTRPETQLKAQYNLGNAYFQQGDYQKAIDAYKKVLAEHPTDEDAKHNLELAEQSLKSQEQEKQQNKEQSSQEQNKESQDQKSASAENEKKQNSAQQQDEQASQSNAQNTDATQKADNSASQAQDEQQMNQATKSQDEPPAQENSDSSKVAEQQPATEQPSTEAGAASTSTLPNEEDVMAEVLLNRLDENPQRLLRGQFYLDAKRSEAPPPTKPW